MPHDGSGHYYRELPMPKYGLAYDEILAATEQASK